MPASLLWSPQSAQSPLKPTVFGHGTPHPKPLSPPFPIRHTTRPAGTRTALQDKPQAGPEARPPDSAVPAVPTAGGEVAGASPPSSVLLTPAGHPYTPLKASHPCPGIKS